MHDAARRRYLASALLAAVTAVPWAVAAHAQQQRPGLTERVSASSSGAQGNASSGAATAPLAITPDCRYVAFVSDASNLVPGDINHEADVFVRDRRTGTTKLASAPSPGAVAQVAGTSAVVCPAQFPAISANGRYVAFSTCRSLDGKAPDTGYDIWRHDFVTGLTTRVSVTFNGTPMLGSSILPSISDDGRYVAFQSTAANLVADDCPNASAVQRESCSLLGVGNQIFVRDMLRGTTRLVSVGSAGQIGDGAAYNPAISADGRFVTFTSNADNLVTNDHNVCTDQTPSCGDVYVRDLRAGTTQLVSVGLDGQAAPVVPGFGFGADINAPASVSGNGRYVVFTSGQSDLVPAEPSVSSQASEGIHGYYVRDLVLHRSERVSVTSAGVQMPLGLGTASIDRTGRYVAFAAVEACGSGTTTSSWSVAIHDRATGDTRLLDRVDANGDDIPCATGFTSIAPVVSSGGRYVAFATNAANLVRGDTNNYMDVVVRDEGTALGVDRIVASARPSAAYVAAAASLPGARLAGAVLVSRPARADVFVRLDLAAMPPAGVAGPPVRYVVSLVSHGTAYQLQVTPDATGAASFRLVRADPDGWRDIGAVLGGYGTAGVDVVAAIPLRLLGAGSPFAVHGVRAATQLVGLDGGNTTLDVLTLH